MTVIVYLPLGRRIDNVINFRAIARGFLADITTTCLFALALTVVIFDPGSSQTSIAERIYGTDIINWLCLLGGLSMTALGGFITARLTPGSEVLHATAMGIVSLFASLSMSYGCPLIDGFTFVGLLLTIPAAQAGGLIAKSAA